MNAPFPPPAPRHGITRAAEGHDRLAFTVEDVRKAQAAGVFSDEDKFELIEGEFVPMGSEGYPHVSAKAALARFFYRAAGSEFIAVDSTLYLSARTFLEPDLYVLPAGLELEQAKGADLLLVIELADSSLVKDLGVKARTYARHGVRELWVIEIETGVTHRHLSPGANGYEAVTAIPAAQELSAVLLPWARLRLADLLKP